VSDGEIMKGNIEAAIEAGRAATSAKERVLEWKGIPVGLHKLTTADGQSFEDIKMLAEVLKASREEAERDPVRRSGTSTHHELDSFISHVNRHKEDRTVVWADQGTVKLTAIFDYTPAGNDPGSIGRGNHRTLYTCPRSPEWQAWKAKNEHAMTAEAMAEFIDARREDLVNPPTGDGECAKPIELIETLRNIEIQSAGTCVRRHNPATGEYEIVSKLEHSEKSTKIPRVFRVALRVFEGGDAYQVEARISWKVREGTPVLNFQLQRIAEIERDAFGDVRKAVAGQTSLPVFAGVPEDPHIAG